MAELEAVSPPLRKSIINKEQLAFEEAVRNVEAEMAHRARESEYPVSGSQAFPLPASDDPRQHALPGRALSRSHM